MKHNRKPTVLLLTSSFPRSLGDETCGYIRDFARSLTQGFTVTVLAPPDRDSVDWPDDSFKLIRSRSLLPRSIERFNARADLNLLASRSPIATLSFLVSLGAFFVRAFVLALRADAIVSHWMVPSGLAGALISRTLRKPHIVVEHSGALHLLARMRGGKTLAGIIVGGSDRIVTVSTDLKRKLLELVSDAEGKIDVLPMGIHAGRIWRGTESRTSNTSTPKTILFIARLTKIKGGDVLLKAIEGLDGVRLVVAGDGDQRDELERQVRDMSINADFVGSVGARARDELFRMSDAVVIPSRVLVDGRTEGSPVVCLEAFAAGRVVVAAKVGGLAELIVDGENGLLFDAEDHRALRLALIRALNDESLRRVVSANAVDTAGAYDWSRVGLKFRNIISRCLRNDHPVRDRRIETGGALR